MNNKNTKKTTGNYKFLDKAISKKRKKVLWEDVIDGIMDEFSKRLVFVKADLHEGLWCLEQLKELANNPSLKTIFAGGDAVLSHEGVSEEWEVLKDTAERYKSYKQLTSRKIIKPVTWRVGWEDVENNIFCNLETGSDFMLNNCSACKKYSIIWLSQHYDVKYNPEFYCVSCWSGNLEFLASKCSCKDCTNHTNINKVRNQILANMMALQTVKIEDNENN